MLVPTNLVMHPLASRLSFAAALLAASTSPRLAVAADGEDTADLEALLQESVVTTASRNEERASVAPASMTTVTAEEMRSAGVRSLDEALELLGLGLYVSRPRDYLTAVDVGAQGILLRDFGRHVLVMLDGVALNSPGTGRISVNEALGVPFDMVDRVEVMLGPGSVSYGSNAMLAVINVVTKHAADLGGVEASAEIGTTLPQDADGMPTAGSGSRFGLRYRLSAAGAKRFRLFGEDGEVTAGGEWLQDLSASYGVTPFSSAAAGNQSFLPGQTTWGGMAEHALSAPSGVVTARVGPVRLTANAYHYERTMPLVGTFNDPEAKEQQSGVRLDLEHLWEVDSKITLRSRAYGGHASFSERSNYGEDFWCLPEQPGGCAFEMSARSSWAGIEQQLTGDWNLDGELVTTVGFDAQLRWFDGTPATYRDLLTGALPSDLPVPHASSSEAIGAIFAQQVWRPLSWLSMNGGARVDLEGRFGARASPRVALVFTPRERSVIRLSYSEAFRAPSQYELTELDPTFRLSPDHLEPETVRGFEVEAQQRVGRVSVSLRGFASIYDGFIEARNATAEEIARGAGKLSPNVDPGQVIVNDNLTTLRVLGGSASLKVLLPAGFSAGATFNLSRAEDDEGEHVERLPTWFGNFRAGWRGDDGHQLSLLGVFAGDRLILYNAQPTAEHIGPRLDLRLAASGPLGAIAGASWRASVGAGLNPDLPFEIAEQTDTPRGYVLYPDQPRFFGFVGLHYALDHD